MPGQSRQGSRVFNHCEHHHPILPDHHGRQSARLIRYRRDNPRGDRKGHPPREAEKRQRQRTANDGKAAHHGGLPVAIEKTGGRQYRYSNRQLFYTVRGTLAPQGIAPEWDWFCKVITDHEDEQGHDLPGMYRDDRGTLYHPHTGETIPLGTRSVEAYQRPAWTFNKILYCEKEGFFPILIDAQWPERHDFALLTSKGYASRAARDVLDLLGDGDEPLTFYCLHDADGPGTMIYQTLQEGTKARPGRRVEIVNLGLDPAEALDMGLPTEPAERKEGKRVPVADYIDAEVAGMVADTPR